jgi:hypothetical protein
VGRWIGPFVAAGLVGQTERLEDHRRQAGRADDAETAARLRGLATAALQDGHRSRVDEGHGPEVDADGGVRTVDRQPDGHAQIRPVGVVELAPGLQQDHVAVRRHEPDVAVRRIGVAARHGAPPPVVMKSMFSPARPAPLRHRRTGAGRNANDRNGCCPQNEGW